MDLERVAAAIIRHSGVKLIVVEGIVALALDDVRELASWRVYLDTPADIRLARKTLRTIGAGRDPRHALRGYLGRGRDAHARHVAPTRAWADLILDGTRPVADLVEQLRELIRA